MAKTAVKDIKETIGKPLNKQVAKPPSKTTKTNANTPNNSVVVDAFMEKLIHPLKEEMEAVRAIIKQSDNRVKEQVKWNAPSFFYREDLATFNPRMQTAVHIVFHHPNITSISSPLLEGDYKDRRMMYLHNMQEINEHKTTLKHIIQELVQLLDK